MVDHVVSTWSATPEVLLERYGVSAHKVFEKGFTMPAPSRGSANSLTSYPRAPPATAPGAPPGRNLRWSGTLEDQGSQRAASAASSARRSGLRGSGGQRSQNQSQELTFFGDAAGGATSSTSSPHPAGWGFQPSKEVQADQPGAGGLSLGDLRSIFTRPSSSPQDSGFLEAQQFSISSSKSHGSLLPSQYSLGSIGETPSTAPGDGVRHRATMHAMPRASTAPRATIMVTEGASQHEIEAQMCADVRKACSDHERKKAHKNHEDKKPRNVKMRKDLKDRAMSAHSEGPAGSGASAGSGEEAECDDDDDDDTWDWSGGVESMVTQPKQRQKLGGKPGTHRHRSNPFVEFEDREMRLNWERRWLKDDDVYMHERMKGMRLDSVQGKLTKESIAEEHLYEDAAFYGPYSCQLRTRKQQKADELAAKIRAATPTKLPPMRKTLSGAAIAGVPPPVSPESEHKETRKPKGDKGKKQTHAVMSLQSMQAMLSESGRSVADNKAAAEQAAERERQAAEREARKANERAAAGQLGGSQRLHDQQEMSRQHS